jgi:hypothetical protein
MADTTTARLRTTTVFMVPIVGGRRRGVGLLLRIIIRTDSNKDRVDTAAVVITAGMVLRLHPRTLRRLHMAVAGTVGMAAKAKPRKAIRARKADTLQRMNLYITETAAVTTTITHGEGEEDGRWDGTFVVF